MVAPGFADEALDILRGSKNVRLLRCAPPPGGSRPPEWRQVDGGLLLQTCRTGSTRPATTRHSWTFSKAAAKPSVAPGPALADSGPRLAMAIRSRVKSNAILLAAGLCHSRRRHGPW